MNLLDRILALQKIKPFDCLNDEEIALLAQAATLRVFDKNTLVEPAHASPTRLYIVIEGMLYSSNNEALNTLANLKELINDAMLSFDIVTQDTPVKVLTISKAHFYTTLYQVPEFTTQLTRQFIENGSEK